MLFSVCVKAGVSAANDRESTLNQCYFNVMTLEPTLIHCLCNRLCHCTESTLIQCRSNVV